VATLTLAQSPVWSQPPADAAAAEALFREGRRLLEEKKYGEACPKLQESDRLDPATGTLLALALCYEGDGKTASAWAAYVDAAGRARREDQKDRERAALDRAKSLEPKLSRVTLVIAPTVAALPDLAVTRDGTPVGRGALGTAVPVDPGPHTVVAT